MLSYIPVSKHHIFKSYSGSGSKTPHVINLGILDVSGQLYALNA
jgi:hypothetical protein